jgi:hypothetical protein
MVEREAQLRGGELQLEKGQWGFATADQVLVIRDLEGGFYTVKTEMATLDSILVKTPVQTAASLPNGDQTGTLRMVLDTNSYWFKTSSTWVQMPNSINSNFYNDTEIKERIEALEKSDQSLDATTNTDADTSTGKIENAPAGTILQTIWNKIRSVVNALAGKQDKLTAGSNITINGSTISASGGSTADFTRTAKQISTAPTSNLDSLTDTGFYRGNWTNGPAGTAYGAVLVMASDNAVVFRQQIFLNESNVSQMWFRCRNGNGWGSWVEAGAGDNRITVVEWTTPVQQDIILNCRAYKATTNDPYHGPYIDLANSSPARGGRIGEFMKRGEIFTIGARTTYDKILVGSDYFPLGLMGYYRMGKLFGFTNIDYIRYLFSETDHVQTSKRIIGSEGWWNFGYCGSDHNNIPYFAQLCG